jgi:hypothetical protein
MAYAIKYIFTFSDVYCTGEDYLKYTCNIYKKDYVGPTIKIYGTGDPLSIETERSGDVSYKPIISSVATLNVLLQDISGLDQVWEDNDNIWNLYDQIWDDAGLDILEFLNADLDTFYIDILKGANTIWKGYYIPTSDVVIREIGPIELTLVFSDLSLLKTVEYFDTDEDGDPIGFYPHEIVSIKDLLLNSLYSANLFSEVRINFPDSYNIFKTNGAISAVGVPENVYLTLDDMYLLKNAMFLNLGEYMSYYDILEGICIRFGLMMYQKNNILYVSSYEGLINNTSRVYKRYASSGGTYIGEITESDSLIALNSSTFRNVGRNQAVRYSLPYKYLDISTNFSESQNIYNGFLWGYEELTSFDMLNGWQNVFNSSFVPVDDYITKTVFSPTSTTYDYGYKFSVDDDTVIDETKFIQPLTQIEVSAGDYIAVSTNFIMDAIYVLDGGLPVNSEARLELSCEDSEGNSFSYTLKTDGTWWNGTGATPVINILNMGIKNILIPNNGVLIFRIFSPWSTETRPGFAGRVALYGRYATINTFRKNSNNFQINAYIQPNLPSTTTSRSYYKNVLNNNKETLKLDTFLNLFNGNAYNNTFRDSTFSKSTAALVGNAVLTKYRDYVQDSEIGSSTQYKVGESLQRNIGLLNTTIEGTFKFSTYYGIGDKFSYSITGGPDSKFAMLDYKINFKNAQNDCILYSCKYVDTTGLIYVHKEIIKN